MSRRGWDTQTTLFGAALAASRRGRADRRVGAQLSRASRTLGNPSHGQPDSDEVVFIFIASARVNFRFCRDDTNNCASRKAWTRAAVSPSVDLSVFLLAE